KANIGVFEAPAGLPVIMVEGKRHRVDSGEILIIEEMLLAWQSTALPTEIGGQCSDNRVKDWDCRNLNTPAALLQRLAKHITNQGKQNNTRVCLAPGDDPIDLTACTYHAPDMLDRLRAFELHKTSPRYGMNSLAGRVGNKMEMKTRHQRPKPADR